MARKRKGIPFPIVTVKWRDAWSASGWHEVEDFKGERGTLCRTTGYLIEENDEALIIAATVGRRGSGGEFDCNTVMCVPKAWVQGRPKPRG